tara:strand:- start:1010 stop:1528 length:519 start_codon:yes stop_codon:yes gene_type:complete
MIKLLSRWIKLLLQSLIESQKPLKESTQKMPTKNELQSDANLLLIRDFYTTKSTLGKLYLNGELFCNTLELAWKDNQRSVSCIPEGEYDVRIRLPRESATRDYLHLLVKEVKDRSYILFHIGNTPKDTKGCILVGMKRGENRIYDSRIAMDLLIKELLFLNKKKINLIIKRK